MASLASTAESSARHVYGLKNVEGEVEVEVEGEGEGAMEQNPRVWIGAVEATFLRELKLQLDDDYGIKRFTPHSWREDKTQ